MFINMNVLFMFVLFFSSVIVTGVTFGLYGKEKKELNKEYKADEGIKREIIDNTGMMSTEDQYYANDYIKAKYKDKERFLYCR